jgi:hypothetical protein
MLKAMKFIVGGVLMLFQCLRGPKTVIEIKRPENALGSLNGFTVRGYEIAIYCHRKEYQIQYARWYVPNRRVVTYSVFSVVSNNAPAALRKACELEIELPALVHNWSFDNDIRRHQVLAYLDLLESRMCANRKN